MLQDRFPMMGKLPEHFRIDSQERESFRNASGQIPKSGKVSGTLQDRFPRVGKSPEHFRTDSQERESFRNTPGQIPQSGKASGMLQDGFPRVGKLQKRSRIDSPKRESPLSHIARYAHQSFPLAGAEIPGQARG
jgi:hypothetical protein